MPHSQFLSWDPNDRSKAIAFAMEKSARCVSCGTAEWEWDQDSNAYQAITEFCPGCYRKDAAQSNEEAAQPGQHVVLIPTSSKQWQEIRDRAEKQYRADVMARLAEKEGLGSD